MNFFKTASEETPVFERKTVCWWLQTAGLGRWGFSAFYREDGQDCVPPELGLTDWMRACQSSSTSWLPCFSSHGLGGFFFENGLAKTLRPLRLVFADWRWPTFSRRGTDYIGEGPEKLTAQW